MENLAAWLFPYLLVGARATGVFLLLPGLPARPWPRLPRMGLCLLLAILLTPLVPAVRRLPSLDQFVLSSAGELALGLSIGFVVRMSFYAMEMGARSISLSVGLVATPGTVDSPTFDQEPLTGSVQLLSQTLFFAVGGHLWVISALAASFLQAPAGAPALAPDVAEWVLGLTSMVVTAGLKLAAPFIVTNLLVNLSFGLLGKVAPKINVFVLSFPVVLFLGLFLFAGAGILFANFFLQDLLRLSENLVRLLPR